MLHSVADQSRDPSSEENPFLATLDGKRVFRPLPPLCYNR
ncbi:hypothetical protein TBK1r_55300 [Stieleria magnilauensis]|uniref:Uncharacterized protein n=1 Tax=Stieleria magnilauensis TaxID=2527963 RepID=A0ABX5XZ08_9BACT|nr:hypothetical protein TBK1r_55300 [Planctomycetes bacterium TBK1r]